TKSVASIGPIPDVHLLFGAADVFVAPSRGEGMPFSVVESICSGTPVVASDLPGHRFLADELDACVLAPREPVPLGRAIAPFLDMTPEQRHAVTATGREWIAGRLDLAASARRLLRDYAGTFEAQGLRLEAHEGAAK